jgi:hypothetical protein
MARACPPRGRSNLRGVAASRFDAAFGAVFEVPFGPVSSRSLAVAAMP